MAVIVNVLRDNSVQSDTIDNITGENVMQVCNRFASEYYEMPEEIFIIVSGKLIEIDLESMIQSELDKQLSQ